MALRLTSLRAAAALLALSSLVACSKKSDDPAVPVTPVGMSWTADGAAVTAASTQKSVSSTRYTFTGSFASAAGSSSVQLQMPNAAGTYLIAAGGNASALYSASVGTTATLYASTSGTITVTSVTATNVTGTFDFVGRDAFGGTTNTKTVSNGKFNIVL